MRNAIRKFYEERSSFAFRFVKWFLGFDLERNSMIADDKPSFPTNGF